MLPQAWTMRPLVEALACVVGHTGVLLDVLDGVVFRRRLQVDHPGGFEPSIGPRTIACTRTVA